MPLATPAGSGSAGSGADRLERQHSEEFSKALDVFIQQGLDGLWGSILPVSLSTAGDHHIDAVEAIQRLTTGRTW